MKQTLTILTCVVFAAAAHAQPIVHINQAGVINAGGGNVQDLGTLDNVDLAGNSVVSIDEVMSRTEGSGGDSWLGLGINAPGWPYVNNGNVGWLSRTRTDSGSAHQLFDAPSGSTQNSSGSDLSGIRRTTTTISLGPNGINNGDMADIVVRYDQGDNGTVDHVLGGSFTWTANSANLDLAAYNKQHNYDVTVASGLQSQFSIFDTGVDDNGAVLAPGAADPHWDITSTPGGGAFGDAVVQQNHGNWLVNDAVGTVGGSSWISTVPQGTTNIAQGNYTFETAFNLDGFDPDTAVLVMEIAVDNSLSNVLLNGDPLGITPAGFGGFNGPFEINSGFVNGNNVLEFLMNNAGGSPNPGGLRVNFLQATASPGVIPEPSTLLIWSLLAALGIGSAAYRRKR
jgi:hypothetical protein